MAPLAEGKADIDWQDPAARKAHLGELVALAPGGAGDEAADASWSRARRSPSRRSCWPRSSTPMSRRTLTANRRSARGWPGTASSRHSDPEMRHGRKSASRRFDGHKIDVIADEDSELILGVDIRAGNAGDGDGAAAWWSRSRSTRAWRSTPCWGIWPTPMAMSARPSGTAASGRRDSNPRPSPWQCKTCPTSEH